MSAPCDPGPKPELAWLPVSKCAVDHRYQRHIEGERSQALIRRIAEDFRWAAFQAILATVDPARSAAGQPVARGSGDDRRWLVLDGQHRLEAAKRVGIEHVPAVVVVAAALEDQAAAFVRANLDRVAVNPFALYHARLIAGDENARAVGQACKAAGVIIPRYQPVAANMKAGETVALGTIAQLVRKNSAGFAALVLKTIARAYGSETNALRASLIRGVWELLAEPFERKERAVAIGAWLSRTPPIDLYAKAARRRETYGGREWECVAAIIKLGVAADARIGRQSPADGEAFIKPLTREQLMGTR